MVRVGEATHDSMHMRIVCWISKATNTQSEYVMLVAFPLQKLLHERPSLLRYMYIACIVVV